MRATGRKNARGEYKNKCYSCVFSMCEAVCSPCPGEHNILIYESLNVFRKIYVAYAKDHLVRQDELLLLVPQYETINQVLETLRTNDVNADKYLEDGTLTIVDSVNGYQLADFSGIYKLAISLLARAKKEHRQGICGFADMGSFFMFRRLSQLVEYESRFTPVLDLSFKVVCCYHAKDYGLLADSQKTILLRHHNQAIFAAE